MKLVESSPRVNGEVEDSVSRRSAVHSIGQVYIVGVDARIGTINVGVDVQ
jgi:hypothetical protein